MSWLSKIFTASWAKKFSMVFSIMVTGFCLVWNIISAGISGEWVTACLGFLAAGGGVYLMGKQINGGPTTGANKQTQQEDQ